MTRNETLASAVNQPVHFLQDSLTNQYFVTQNVSVVVGVTSTNIEDERPSDRNGFSAAIRVGDGLASCRRDP